MRYWRFSVRSAGRPQTTGRSRVDTNLAERQAYLHGPIRPSDTCKRSIAFRDQPSSGVKANGALRCSTGFLEDAPATCDS